MCGDMLGAGSVCGNMCCQGYEIVQGIYEGPELNESMRIYIVRRGVCVRMGARVSACMCACVAGRTPV